MTSSATHTQAPLATDRSDREGIAQAVQHYIEGAISGRGDDMKPGFHPQATIFGYVGDDLMAGPIQQLYDWNDTNGAATELQALIVDGRARFTAHTAFDNPAATDDAPQRESIEVRTLISFAPVIH